MVDTTTDQDDELATQSHVRAGESQVPGAELTAMAARLEDLRRARGLRSVRAFALACDLNVTPVQNYFKAKSAPNAASMRKIAASLKVSIDWLTRGEGPMDYLMIGDTTPDGFRVEQGPTVPLEQLPHHGRPVSMFASANMPRLAKALEIAHSNILRSGGSLSYEKWAQALALIYDMLETMTPDMVQHVIDFGAATDDPP